MQWLPFPESVAKGSCFWVGVWGRDRVRSGFGNVLLYVRSRSRARGICSMRRALRIGVDRGCLVGVLRRCAVGIGGRRVVSDALCPWDWRGGRRVGRAVPLGVPCYSTTVFNIVFATTVFVRDKHCSSERPLCPATRCFQLPSREISVYCREIAVNDHV